MSAPHKKISPIVYFIGFTAALAGLLDEDHQAKTKAITDEGRTYLQDQFAAMGLEYVPSYANFVLVKVGDGNAVFKAMMQQGIIIRAMAAYKLPEWVRISIGTMAQNRRCIELLREVLAR
jgi:histidinol-phosphate aminotransferase